jgi:hypothetical protein
MPRLPGINHQQAVKAFQKYGFWILAGIIGDAGLNVA